MRTLVNEINGRKDFPIFKGTNEKLVNWVRNNLDLFELNESWSCSVTFDSEDCEILILGDEDYLLLKIIDAEIINL